MNDATCGPAVACQVEAEACADQLTAIWAGSAAANAGKSLYIAWDTAEAEAEALLALGALHVVGEAEADSAAEETACEGDAICKPLMDCRKILTELAVSELNDMIAAEDAAAAAKATSGAAAIVPCTAVLLAAATIWA